MAITMTRSFHLSILFFITPCSSQILRPHKILQKILNFHENGDKAVSSEDTLSLYVDITEAKKQKPRDDFQMRIFNRDKNITVCEGRMVDYVDSGKFPCNFRAADVGLHHGANHFQFEVYSDLNGKRYASRNIPDIHLFDQYIYEGYHDNLYLPSQASTYQTRFALATLLALLAAYTVDTGYSAIASELSRMASSITKIPRLALSTAVTNSMRGAYAASAHGVKIISATTVTSSLKMVASVSSGLLASTAVSKTTSKVFLATSIAAMASYLPTLYSMIGVSSPLNGERLITAIHGLSYGFKTISNVVVPSIQLLYDIFLAGIRSPINLIMSILLLGLSHLQRLFGDMQKKVFVQESNSSNAEGPPPGPEFKKNPKTDTVPRKKGYDINGFLPTHPTTYSYNSSSIPTKVAQAFVKKTPTPLLIMAVPVQSQVPGVHETPRRSLFRSILRTVCLCLTIFALAPISRFDKSSALNILSNIQRNEVFKNLKFKYHAVCASTAQLLDNWLRKTKGTNDLAATPRANQDRAYSERYNPQPRPGCPFFKKSNIR